MASAAGATSAVQQDRLLPRKAGPTTSTSPSSSSTSDPSSPPPPSTTSSLNVLGSLDLRKRNDNLRHKSSASSLLDKVSRSLDPRAPKPTWLTHWPCFLLACLQGFEDDSPNTNKTDWIFLGVIFALAAALRFYGIRHPSGVV